LRFLEHRHLWTDLHIVAGQGHAALNLGVIGVHQGNRQLELALQGPTGPSLRQGARQHAVDGRLLQGAQDLLRGAFQIGLDAELAVMGQIWNIGAEVLHLHGLTTFAKPRAGACQVHALSLEHQLALDAPQGGPRHAACGQQVGRHIGHLHILQMPGEAEFAVADMRHRHLVQIAFDADLQAADRTRPDALAHIAAHLGRQVHRQVAVNPVGLSAGHLGLQVQPAQAAARDRLPLALDLALQVVVADLGFPLRGGDLLLMPLPMCIGLQLSHVDPVFFQQPGPGQPAVLVDADLRLATLWIPLRVQLHALQTGSAGRCAGQGFDVQLFGIDLALQVLCGLQRAFPLQLQ